MKEKQEKSILDGPGSSVLDQFGDIEASQGTVFILPFSIYTLFGIGCEDF